MKTYLPFKNRDKYNVYNGNSRAFKVISVTLLWAWFIFLCALIYGWFANVVYLLGMLGGDANALFIARLAGLVLAPLGAILGYYP